MKYDLSIQDTNLPAHLDIEKDIQAKQNGLFTFNLRVNGGNICDYNPIEQVNINEYVDTAIIIQKFTITLSDRECSQANAVGNNNLQRGDTQRDSDDSPDNT